MSTPLSPLTAVATVVAMVAAPSQATVVTAVAATSPSGIKFSVPNLKTFKLKERRNYDEELEDLCKVPFGSANRLVRSGRSSCLGRTNRVNASLVEEIV
jgi:hypothetical protein